MISVIVPAHNESAVIERCLSAMLGEASPGEIEVVVVCNGCSDDTADRVRAFGHADVVLAESPVASKHAALTLGDATASHFPRFYVDADIVLTTHALRSTTGLLRDGPALAAAPRLDVNLDGCSWAIRAYHTVWMQLPYVTSRMIGSGVYGLSREGRERIGEWPALIADDEIARLSFSYDERATAEDASFEFTPPRSIAKLVHINVRRRAGQEEVAERMPRASAEAGRHQRSGMWRLMLRPSLWPGLAVFSWVRLRTLIAYRRSKARGEHKAWNRDETSRA